MKAVVIIPAYNEAWNIRRLIYNLLYVQDHVSYVLEKIIVVCSGCTDGTDMIVKEIASKNRKVCLIMEDRRSGKARAINMAIKTLKSGIEEVDVVVFLSGDVVPKRNSLEKLLNKFRSPFVGCAISNPAPLNTVRNSSERIVKILWKLHDEMNKLGWHKVTGEMFAVRYEVLEEIPEGIINDDLYIEYLVKKSNLSFVYVPESIVYIWGPTSLLELLEQRRRVNRGHIQFAKKYKAQHFSLRGVIKLISILLTNCSLVDAFLFVSIEGLSRMLAFIDNLRGACLPLWKPIITSKGGSE